MKKTLSFVLTLVLALAVAVPAFATEGNTIESATSKEVTVKYDYSESYVVTIPTDFNTSPTTEGSVEVSAKGRLSYGKTLKVTISSAHEESSTWNLANEQGQKIPYYLFKTTGGNPPLTNNAYVLSVSAESILPDTNTTSTLYHKITAESVQYAGIYQDTLTFTVSVS